jgi:hypothetical protein
LLPSDGETLTVRSSIRSIFPISFHSQFNQTTSWCTIMENSGVWTKPCLQQLQTLENIGPSPYFSTILNLPNISTTT